MSVWIPLRDNSYTNWGGRAACFDQLRAKMDEVPGVLMAAVATNSTPPGRGWNMLHEIQGQPGLGDRKGDLNLVRSQYFGALRIPLIQGRIWNEAENRRGAHLAVVNRTFSRLHFPNGDAIGHSLRLPSLQNRPPMDVAVPGIADAWVTIVGVINDVRNDGLRNPEKPAIYVARNTVPDGILSVYGT